jgi:hypothetical protein
MLFLILSGCANPSIRGENSALRTAGYTLQQAGWVLHGFPIQIDTEAPRPAPIE